MELRSFLAVFGCLLVFTEAQNMTSPMEILNTMKTSVEAAGAGGLKLGPMGLFGDMNGQFGLKVNKEQTSSATTSTLVKHVGDSRVLSKSVKEEKRLVHATKSSLKKEDPKNCYRRYGRSGQPIIIPIILSTTAATTTTTTAAPN